METQATPRQWHITGNPADPFKIWDGDKVLFAECGGCGDNARGLAALIVRCVNSHSLMLDALRGILATRDIQYAQQLADEALHAAESMHQVQGSQAT